MSEGLWSSQNARTVTETVNGISSFVSSLRVKFLLIMGLPISSTPTWPHIPPHKDHFLVFPFIYVTPGNNKILGLGSWQHCLLFDFLHRDVTVAYLISIFAPSPTRIHTGYCSIHPSLLPSPHLASIEHSFITLSYFLFSFFSLTQSYPLIIPFPIFSFLHHYPFINR